MRVAIIGAGVAGLTAARELRLAGHHIEVFERASQPGGRLATRVFYNVELPRMGTVDLAFDHGAQYFTVRDQRFAAAVNEWFDKRWVAKWAARIVSFDHEGWEEVGDETTRYVAVPSMGALGTHLAEELLVTCDTRVTTLTLARTTPVRWRVLANVDDLGEFDHIVLAVPPRQARTLLPSGAPVAGAFATVDSKPCWAVLAAFEEPVTSRFDAAFVSGSPLGWIARNSSKPKRDYQTETWVLHATADWSAAHAEDRGDTAGPFLLESFADLIRAGLPRPFFLNAFRWRDAVVDPPLSAGALHDPEFGLTICGDWCAGARLEDAFISGLTAASLLLSSSPP